MIPNLKNRLQNLPKAEIIKECAPVRDYDCSVFHKEFAVDEYDNLKSFASSDIYHLKTACKITDDISLSPEEIVFFDTETTGLAGGAGTVAFLVGVGRLQGGVFKVSQFLMNDYHQELSVLNEFAHSLDGAKAVATYNGKSFDAPLITARSIMNRVTLELDKYTHFDLLHACRRLYKMRMERMKLTDVEQYILGMEREDDIPGSEIPEIFFNYLKYGQSSLLDKVIEHNLNDIVSLAKISGVLSHAYSKPEQNEFTEDKYSIARTLIGMSRFNEAYRVLNAMQGEYEDAKVQLAYLKKKMGDFEGALLLFDELSYSSRFKAEYDIEAAKISEHKLRNYEQALNYAKRAKEKASNNRLLGRTLDIMDDVDLRISRLEYKIGRERECL